MLCDRLIAKNLAITFFGIFGKCRGFFWCLPHIVNHYSRASSAKVTTAHHPKVASSKTKSSKWNSIIITNSYKTTITKKYLIDINKW